MNKQTILIIVVGIGLIGLLYYFTMKKTVETTAQGSTTPTTGNSGIPVPKFEVPSDSQLMSYFRELINIYGPTTAKYIEQIFRLETAHFTSGQYLASGSPGMIAFSSNYPYGWNSTKTLWDNDANMRPVGTVNLMKHGKSYPYLVFPNFYAAARAVGEHITKYRPGRWNSTDPVQQQAYENKLRTITTKYT